MTPERAEQQDLLKLGSLQKTYANSRTALASIDLTVRKGELLSILGPSGCGKTTLLRIIAGLERPSAGTITWIADNGAKRREIGYVFQEPTLLPWANVFENVYLPFRLRHISRAEARDKIVEALNRVGLVDFAFSLPRELSAGMKMRVSLARALVTQPQILLMDEPFAALDEMTRAKLNDDLLYLWRQADITIVFVTHSVFESVYLSQRIAVMSAQPGRVAQLIDIPDQGKLSPTYRMSVDYAAHCVGVSQALEAAAFFNKGQTA